MFNFPDVGYESTWKPVARSAIIDVMLMVSC